MPMRSATARASWISRPGAARALTVRRRAVIVELQRDADDVVARASASRAAVDRGIDAARHGDDDARIGWTAVDVEIVGHCGADKLPGPAAPGGAPLRQQGHSQKLIPMRRRASPPLWPPRSDCRRNRRQTPCDTARRQYLPGGAARNFAQHPARSTQTS